MEEITTEKLKAIAFDLIIEQKKIENELNKILVELGKRRDQDADKTGQKDACERV